MISALPVAGWSLTGLPGRLGDLVHAAGGGVLAVVGTAGLVVAAVLVILKLIGMSRPGWLPVLALLVISGLLTSGRWSDGGSTDDAPTTTGGGVIVVTTGGLR
ncbi:hypothetical protein [Acidipropionibacterium acidipropionici]|uniref:hypothetical protein n=1 Tax=Acidipropionibacterium acidipropionici TaxID=1748 RepID=UPI0004203800|nr:hypothetical protein [Acidipropionibacterium acidipropionici]ALN14375.1 hypothetical protein ASQ49_02790 [Acidipropionibacterium acidipropionici]APZ09864.1 hypothetical protein BWX38_12160 [Acidipropionibacterium acidipropionici]